MTAGHCSNVGRDLFDSSGAGGTDTKIDLDTATLDGYDPGARDSQFHRLSADGVADPSFVRDGDNSRTIVRSTLNPGNGAWICQFGRKTNAQRCGTVTNNNHTSTSNEGGPTLFNTILTSADISPGDSGGPVFSGDRAIGLLSRGRTCILPSTGQCLRYTQSVIVRLSDALAGTGFTLLGPGNSGRFVPVAPARVYNTVTSSSPPLAAQGSGRSIRVRGVGGVPDHPNVSAVALNVTTVNPSGNGHLKVYADGSQEPVASTGNYRAGQTLAHHTTVALDQDDDDIRIWSHASTHVMVDVVGYYRLDYAPNRTTLLNTPIRTLDTRNINGLSDPLGPGEGRTFNMPAQVPANAASVVVNVTMFANSSPTHVHVDHPLGSFSGSTVNSSLANVATANVGVVRARNGGARAQIRIRNNSGTTHALVDVLGYTASSGSSLYAPIQPTRVVNTKTDLNRTDRIGPNQTITVQLGALTSPAVIPYNATGLQLRITSVAPTANSHLTVSRWGSSGTSNLNVRSGITQSNSVYVPLDGNNVKIYNKSGWADLIIDVEGYYHDG